jgi:hypothetical protein
LAAGAGTGGALAEMAGDAAGGAGFGASGAVAVDGCGAQDARPDFPGWASQLRCDDEALTWGQAQSDRSAGLHEGLVGGVVEGVQSGSGDRLAPWAGAAGVRAFFAVAAGTVDFLFGVGDRLIVGRAGFGWCIGLAGDLAPALDVAGQGPQVGDAALGILPVAGA